MLNNNFEDNNEIITTYSGDVIETGTAGTLKQVIHEGAKALKEMLDDVEQEHPGTKRTLTATTVIGICLTFIADATILLTA